MNKECNITNLPADEQRDLEHIIKRMANSGYDSITIVSGGVLVIQDGDTIMIEEVQ